MTAAQIEEEFAPRGDVRGGVLLLAASDALALVRRARHARVPVLGVDTFRVRDGAAEPLPEHAVDFTGASCRVNPWAEAEAFLEDHADSGWRFAVALEAEREGAAGA